MYFICRAHTKNTQKAILPILKALSDKSKFDILHSLLIAPKYNLELAEELDLTAATVSHHMNVLLTNKLVDIEKKEVIKQEKALEKKKLLLKSLELKSLENKNVVKK